MAEPAGWSSIFQLKETCDPWTSVAVTVTPIAFPSPSTTAHRCVAPFSPFNGPSHVALLSVTPVLSLIPSLSPCSSFALASSGDDDPKLKFASQRREQ